MPDEPRIKLKIDLASGTIELDAPAESFEHAIEKTKELAGSIDFGGGRPLASNPLSDVEQKETIAPAQPPLPQPAPKTRARPGKSASSGRSGRIGSFEAVPNFLTEDQEIALRAAMEMAPSDQADQALVAVVKGEQLLGRRAFSFNEIYTLLWLGGVKDLPKALDVVIQRLLKDQMVVREDGGFTAKFLGRNRVERDLLRAA